MSELKSCPFCGSSKIIVWGRDVMCDNCEARGPARQTIARAKEEWNKRVDEQSSEKYIAEIKINKGFSLLAAEIKK